MGDKNNRVRRSRFGVVASAGVAIVCLLVAVYAYSVYQPSSVETDTSEGINGTEQSTDKTSSNDQGSMPPSNDSGADESDQNDTLFGWMGSVIHGAVEQISIAEESTTGQKGSIQVFDVLASERPKNGASFVMGSLELRLAATFVPGSTVSQDRKQVIAPGEGVYVAQTNGSVRYTPESDFIGTAVGVVYTVLDTNGV